MIWLSVALATPLGGAVSAGRAERVAELLANGADPNGLVIRETTAQSGFWVFKNTKRISTHTTPLHLALEADRLDIATLLLEAGADPDAVTAHRLPPLHHVALRGSSIEPQIALLRSHGAQPEGRFRGRTALAAAKAGTEDLVLTSLLAHGADLSALVCGARARDLERLEARGGDVRAPCGRASLLHRAVVRRDEALVTELLARGFDASEPGVVAGVETTPLALAVRARWNKGVELLLEAGADPMQAVGLTGVPAVAHAHDRAPLVRAGAPRVRSDAAELWAVRPVEPEERGEWLTAWALEGLVSPAPIPSPELREAFPIGLADAPVWPQLAAGLHTDDVAEALRLPEPGTCLGEGTFEELVERWGLPATRERRAGVKIWRWDGHLAIGRGREVLQVRGCDDALVGRSRAFVWLALGPGEGREVERRGTHRVWYEQGVVVATGEQR